MLTQERLKELLEYNPDTGNFIALIGRSQLRRGMIAGTHNSGRYVTLKINNSIYYAHRLAFLYMEGKLPINDVDHINQDKKDNRWVNLRHAIQPENGQNVDVKSSNTSGIPGVDWHKRTRSWRARIRVKGKRLYLGDFKSLEDAAKARQEAEIKYFGEFRNYHAKITEEEAKNAESIQ